MNAAETYMVDTVLHSEALRRLGSETSRTQAYLDGYEVNQGFSAVVSANEALAGLMLYSVPNNLYMAQYGTVSGGGPEQKTRPSRESRPKSRNWSVPALWIQSVGSPKRWVVARIGCGWCAIARPIWPASST